MKLELLYFFSPRLLIIRVARYTCYISVYCTICCFLIVKQCHFTKCYNSIHHYLKHFTKSTKLVLYLICVKGNTSRFGSAIQVLPSDIGEYFSSYCITVVVVVFIFLFLFFLLLRNLFFIYCKFFCQE